MKDKKITIRDIAKACGVTTATVSRAINNKPGMRNEVRKAILEYIENIGWQCNTLKLRLDKPAVNNNRVLFLSNMSQINNAGFKPIHTAMSVLIKLLEKQGFSSFVAYGAQSEALKHCVEIKPYAVVLFSATAALNSEIEQLQQSGIRVVVAFGECNGLLCPCVQSDHYSLGVRAAERFQERGINNYALFAPMGLFSKPKDYMRNLSRRYSDIINGILSVNSHFNHEENVLSDNYCKPDQFLSILKSNKYDGWICIGREQFDIFCHYTGRMGIRTPEDLPAIAVLAESTPYDPVTCFDRFYEPGEVVAQQVFELLMEKEVSPMEYRISYIFKEALSTGSVTH